MSTKIHIAVDALGNVLRLLYTGGHVHDSTKAEDLIIGLPAENVLGDKAFDTDRFRAFLAIRGTAAVIERVRFLTTAMSTRNVISSNVSSTK